MATYVERFGGYVQDVPIVYFNRCDGAKFVLDELTSASVTPNIEYNDIKLQRWCR